MTEPTSPIRDLIDEARTDIEAASREPHEGDATLLYLAAIAEALTAIAWQLHNRT